MAGSEIYRVEIPIIVDDQSDAPLRRAEERVSRFQCTAEQRTKMVRDRLNELGRMRVQPHLELRERITQRVREVSSSLRQLTSRGWSVVVDVKDKATGAIRGIVSKARSLIASPLMLLGVGGGVAGATAKGLSMVMEEQDLVSAFEVMLGTREAAEKRMKDLITFAGQTPFTRQEIWRSSRQLELLTGGALSTGAGLRLVGDIAAGTVQPFEEVAMWVGRLYDGLKSGRPIGQAAMRLQEMGALSGESRAKLEKLADSGRGISEIWPMAAKEFERFGGLMEKQSLNLRNIVLGTKTFFTENIIKRWGQGIADVLQPALMRFRQWRGENTETIARMGEAIQRFGRDVGGFLVGHVERAIERVSKIMSDPKFESATFGEKVRMMVAAALDDVIAWLDSEGKDRMVQVFTSMGEAAAKGYIAGMKALGSRAVEELKQGNLKGAAVPAGAMYLLGGAAIARGAWGLGRGALAGGLAAGRGIAKGAGAIKQSQIFRNLIYGDHLTAAARTAPAAARVATTSAAGGTGRVVMGRVGRTIAPPVAESAGAAAQGAGAGLRGTLGTFARRAALPVAIGLEAYQVYRADDKVRAAAEGGAGLISAAAGAKMGAALGTVILPGIGTVIGGFLGGTGGYVAGRWLGSKAVDAVRGGPEEAMAGVARTGVAVSEQQERIARTGQVYLSAQGDIITSNGFVINSQDNLMQAFTTLAQAVDYASAKLIAFSGIELAPRAPSMGDFKQMEYQAHATGGILTRPHFGMVAEAGPEAIIPLAGHRSRALALWQEAGRRLGARPYNAGGIVGAIPTAAGGGDINVVSNVSVTIDGGSGDVVAYAREIADAVTGEIALNLRKVFQNMAN